MQNLDIRLRLEKLQDNSDQSTVRWIQALCDAGYLEEGDPRAPSNTWSEWVKPPGADGRALDGSINDAAKKSALMCRRLQNIVATAGDPIAEAFWQKLEADFNSIAGRVRLDRNAPEGQSWSISGAQIDREYFRLAAERAGRGLGESEEAPKPVPELARVQKGKARSRGCYVIELEFKLAGMKARGLSQFKMCGELDDDREDTPPGCKWTGMTWVRAFRDHRSLVAKYLSLHTRTAR